jgi:hypothetical protein
MLRIKEPASAVITIIYGMNVPYVLITLFWLYGWGILKLK